MLNASSGQALRQGWPSQRRQMSVVSAIMDVIYPHCAGRDVYKQTVVGRAMRGTYEHALKSPLGGQAKHQLVAFSLTQ